MKQPEDLKRKAGHVRKRKNLKTNSYTGSEYTNSKYLFLKWRLNLNIREGNKKITCDRAPLKQIHSTNETSTIYRRMSVGGEPRVQKADPCTEGRPRWRWWGVFSSSPRSPPHPPPVGLGHSAVEGQGWATRLQEYWDLENQTFLFKKLNLK